MFLLIMFLLLIEREGGIAMDQSRDPYLKKVCRSWAMPKFDDAYAHRIFVTLNTVDL